jgi:phosphoribosylformylglycinamidine (FGAM) synthase-like enzyme
MDTVDATGRDWSRQAATSHDNEFTLTLEEVAERYARAGHPRTLRTLQRYCAGAHLDAQKIATTTGDKYLVTPQSVDRHIAQIVELSALELVATGRDVSRHVATADDREDKPSVEPSAAATGDDTVRQVATATSTSSVDAARLEREVERLEDDRDFLREQIKVKDGQIASLLERDRETNILIRGLQEMLTPLLGAPRHDPPMEDRPMNPTG